MGKTSTKDAIFSVLASTHHVRKSEKSLNSEVGVPLAILGCESGWNNPFKWLANIGEGLALIVLKNHYPHWLVLEVGADRPGDIRRLARWLRPNIAVITGIPDLPPHIEYFSSVEEVAAEKRTLAEALAPEGTLVLNGDEERTHAMRIDFRGAAITYGFAEHNDISASHEGVQYENGKPSGMFFRITREGSSIPFEIHGALGRTPIYPVLAAIVVADVAGVDMVAIGRAISEHTPPVGRMRVLPGYGGSTIIDDTYNSSPAPAFVALDALDAVETNGRKIAVLGDMLELGKHTGEAHRALGEYAGRIADTVVTVGIRAKATAEAARETGLSDNAVHEYDAGASSKAGEELRDMLQPGDVVLVKGSQGIRMERTVRELLTDPERAPELLVRQDPEWTKRP